MKTDILLLHGALGASSQFDELAQKLSDHFNIHRINFSGHGGQPFQDKFSIAQFASELNTYISKFPDKAFSVFGYSMGGYVALYLERNAPGSFRSIFTLATKFDWNPESAHSEAAMLNAEKMLEKVPAFAQVLIERHQPSAWKELLQKTAEMMKEMGNKPPLSNSDFAAIQIPVLLCRGDLDRMVSKEETLQVAHALPNGFFKSYPEWPHPIEKCDVEILARDIVCFVKDNQ